ncbi:transposase [Komagataeibacter sp. FXV3]|uniref:transposase n=1 Tax=Komagataeibacter sp. FXV3 TaxID=2608998 RepID=UPI00187B943C|nr:transposase [Komagataeibacter sp. FXV3]
MKHTGDFKREAVRIALSNGPSRTRVAIDLGIGKSTPGNLLIWCAGMNVFAWTS